MPKTPVVKRININPNLISLKPRQLLLAKPNMNINKASVTILKPEQKALLLRSIAGYLKSNGFSKTLKKFLSEAQLEKDDFSASSLVLEHMCCKFLETCDHESTSLSSKKVQDIQVDGKFKRGEGADIVAGIETVNKKKKKKDDEGSHAVVRHSEDSAKLTNSNETEKQISKEKRKNKKIPDSLIQTSQVSLDVVKKPAADVVSDTLLSEPDKKHKDKKKKGKLDSESPLSNIEPIGEEDKRGTEAEELKSFRDFQATESTMVNSNNISVEDGSVKSKGKKKKKDRSIYKVLCNGNSKEIDEQKSGGAESKNDGDSACKEDATDKERKGSKKRKRPASEENNSEPIDKKEVEESKRRKTEGSEKLKGSGEITQMNASVGTNRHFGNDVKGESDKLNVNSEKKGEKSAPNESLKQENGSAEPKTVKAFQRVKVDEVVFTDERLKDNSYWAKDGAESGYGAKAQEVLGQVRGRGFRHEKTKKKRGSYRGGQIDLQSHSIKFNFSDDD